MRGALVLFEGLPPTVVDSQVLAHARLAREVLGIDLVVVAVACSQTLFDSSRKRLARARELAGGEVYLTRGVRPAFPGSLVVNRGLLGRALARLGPIDFVHARADYATAVAGSWGRRRGVPVLWDCRGDSRAELQERLTTSAGQFYRMILLEHELAVAGRAATSALFVTSQLRDAMRRYLRDQPSRVIPCLAPETEFFFDHALRARVRAELGIAHDELAYIYSGSLAAYQRFEETVAFFRAALTTSGKARLIVLTPEVERAKRICAELPANNIICKTVAHAEVNGYLNAADVGMLLRDSSAVNLVAFPTKFAEYSMAGLRVIMKEAPPACVSVARELGNYLSMHAATGTWTVDERKRCADSAAPRLGRGAAMQIYGEIYAEMAALKQ